MRMRCVLRHPNGSMQSFCPTVMLPACDSILICGHVPDLDERRGAPPLLLAQ